MIGSQCKKSKLTDEEKRMTAYLMPGKCENDNWTFRL